MFRQPIQTEAEMQLTNEQAIQRLAETKAKEKSHAGATVSDFTMRSYYAGLHLGLAEAYWQLGIITLEQYMQATEPEMLSKAAADGFTAEEIGRAYRRANLRRTPTSLLKAHDNKHIYRSLCHMAEIERKQQQHGKPAPQLQAA